MEKNNCVNCKINYCVDSGSNRKWEDGFECGYYVSACTSSKKPAREPQEELVTVPLILPIDLRKKVDALAAQCGLTSEQIASAMIVLAFKNIEPVESEPPKPATISINGVELKAPDEIDRAFDDSLRFPYILTCLFKSQCDRDAAWAALEGKKDA